MGKVLGGGVPAYLWIAVFYVVFVLVIAAPEVGGSLFGGSDPTPTAESTEGTTEGTTADGAAATTDEATVSRRVTATVEDVMREPFFTMRFFSGVDFPISATTLFIMAGFLAAWIEAIRATNARVSGNDFMSLIVTVVSLVLFVGVPWFSTTAFMIVPLVGIGDLILDRYIGQAVARRDFGGVFPGHHGGGGD